MRDDGPFDFGRRPSSGDPIEDLQRLWREIKRKLPANPGSGFGVNPWLLVLIAAVLYALSGIYIVAPDERGLVLRFGRFVREAEPGPNYHLPWPIEQVVKPSVTQIRKEEFGFRTVSVGPPARYQRVNAEALMLTGDENIVQLEFIVQYRIRPDANGPRDFVFNLRDPQATLRDSAEAAMREVIGQTKIDDAMTEGRLGVEERTLAVLQAILDTYSSGIEALAVKLQDVGPPTPVSDAFKDVISAQQDKERLINESLGYANDVVPRARGQAAQMLNQAEAYKEAKVREAGGVADRFTALQEAYSASQEVTRRRLYLETMEAILPGMNKILIDETAGRQVLPYLPLDAAARRRADMSNDPGAP
jgi:membrane protease subunit HflK